MNDILLLLQWLQQHVGNGISKPSVSDTPGMGEMAPYQMPGLTGRLGPQQPSMPQGASPAPDQRMLLERLLLDEKLRKSLQSNKLRQDLQRLHEQDQFQQPGQQWDFMPGSGMGRYM